MKHDSHGSTDLTRRTVLTAAAGVAGVVAGCTSGAENATTDDSDDDAPGAANDADASEAVSNGGIDDEDVPDFAVDDTAQPTPILLAAEVIEPSTPIRFLDRFTVELAVGNAGGAAIGNQSVELTAAFTDDDDSYVEAVDDPAPVPVGISGIESGDWTTVEAELRVNAGGNWKVTSDATEHPEFDLEIAVEPRRLAVGESVASDVGHFEITALEPRFERALHYDTEEGGVGLLNGEATGLFAAGDGHVIVLHRFRVENTSSDRSLGFGQVYSDNRFTDARLEGEPTDIATADDLRDSLTTLRVDEHGTVFANNDIPPGESAELIAVQEVPESEVRDSSVTLSLWGDTEDVVFDTVEETPSLPKFELVDATVIERDDADPLIEATVENAGDAPGTFRGAGQFYHSRSRASDWVYLPDGMTATLDPGERQTVSTVASRGGERVRIEPFGEELSLPDTGSESDGFGIGDYRSTTVPPASPSHSTR